MFTQFDSVKNHGTRRLNAGSSNIIVRFNDNGKALEAISKL